MRFRKPFVASIAIAILMLSTLLPSGFAHNTGRSHHHSSRSSRNSRTGRSAASAAAKARANLVRAAAIRTAAVRAAQAEVRRAHTALRSSRTLLKRHFELSPKMSNAMDEDSDAHKEFAKMRQAVLSRIAKDSEYQNAQRIKQERRDATLALRASGRASQSQIKARSKRMTQAAAVVTKLETAAIDKDPAARQARQHIDSTAARVRELRRGFESTLTQNPRWKTARKDLEAARRKLAQANAAGNKALANASRNRSNQRYSSR